MWQVLTPYFGASMFALAVSACPASTPPRSSPRWTSVVVLAALSMAVALTGPLAVAQASEVVPATPGGLTDQIEAAQPYVGQSTCDPVAKPGVSAFRDVLLRTYPDTGSSGIVQDCGVSGQSEHKEGRAFDWAVSVNNSQHVQEVNALLTWLTQPDRYGHPYAMAKRLGIMYMIWDHRMWRSYATASHSANRWDPYVGVSAHTDHVHFSFGWNGAQKATSFWRGGVVAPTFAGPIGPGSLPAPPPAPVPAAFAVVPVIRVSNAAIVASYGQTTLLQGSSGAATIALQRGLGLPADGNFGPQTSAAVSAFQAQHGMAVTGGWGTGNWPVLFPVPSVPPISAGNVAVLRDYGQLTLTAGSAGTAVADLQRALNIAADGAYGPQTIGAVQVFQAQQELPITGTWGPQDWQRMFPVPVSAPVSGVTISGGARQSPSYGAPFVISGTAPAGSLVTLHFYKAGTAAGVFDIVRTAQADAAGLWARPILADVDYRYYATVPSGTSTTTWNTPSPTLDGPPTRIVARGLGYLLTGRAAPGSAVLLNFHNADLAPGDYSVVRTVAADASGAWSRSFIPVQDCRLLLSGVDGRTSGVGPALVQAR